MPDEFLGGSDDFAASKEFWGAPEPEADPSGQPIPLDPEKDPETRYGDAMEEYFRRLDEQEANIRKKFESITDSRFFVCVCFYTADQCREWIEKAGLQACLDSEDPQYMDGVLLASKMGIEVTPCDFEMKKKKVEKRYLDMSDPLP